MEQAFGAYLKRLRLERGLSLRDFCHRAQADPSNFSKLERGLLNPPQPDRLADFLQALELSPMSEEARELERLAAIGRGQIPPAILSNKELAGKLPLFFRTLENGPLTEETVQEVVETIREAWSHDPTGTV